MENIQGETPNPNGETPGDENAGGNAPAVEANAEKPEKPGETPAEPNAEAEALRKALENERKLRKQAEADAVKKARTVEDRVAELEAENQRMKVDRLRDKTVDEIIAEVTKDGKYTVNRADVMELLEDVNLTEANMADAVRRRVEKLKRIPAVETPENTTKAMSAAGKVEASLKNPWAGANL